MTVAPVLAGWIAAAFLAAVALGWLLRGLWSWLCMTTSSDRARIAELADQLHLAEEAREAAEAARAAAEARAAAHREELERLRADCAAHAADCEARAARAVAEAEAEARTAWDGLAAARRRIAALERGSAAE